MQKNFDGAVLSSEGQTKRYRLYAFTAISLSTDSGLAYFECHYLQRASADSQGHLSGVGCYWAKQDAMECSCQIGARLYKTIAFANPHSLSLVQ